jgi:hypothetical protein
MNWSPFLLSIFSIPERRSVFGAPTLSAERKVTPGSRSVEKRMSKNGILRLGVGHTNMLATPEIAQ